MFLFSIMLTICMYDIYVVCTTGEAMESFCQTFVDIAYRSPITVFTIGAMVDHLMGWTMFPSISRCVECGQIKKISNE